MGLFCPLASGSKGNCLYFETKQTKLLIDAGLSAKQIALRLKQIERSLEEIDAIIVTHEHTDHIAGIKRVCQLHNIPIFSNTETAKGIYANFQTELKFKIFTTGEPFLFRDCEILPFSVQHDTLDPVALRIDYEGKRFGICTDTGIVTTQMMQLMKECDYLLVEANHQPSMVHACSRPSVYKRRVLGRQGHLSNEECLKLLRAIQNPKLKHIFLAHLSEECNHPDLALKMIQEEFPKIPVSIAYQEKISKFIEF